MCVRKFWRVWSSTVWERVGYSLLFFLLWPSKRSNFKEAVILRADEFTTTPCPPTGAKEAVGRAAPRQQAGRGGRELSPVASPAAAVAQEATAGGTAAGQTSGGGRSSGDGSRGCGTGALGVGEAGDHGDNSCFDYSDDTENDEDEGAYERSTQRRRLLQNGGCLAVGVLWSAALLLLLLLWVGGGSRGGPAAAKGVGGGTTAASWEILAAAGCALLGAVVLAALARFVGLPTWRDESEEDQEDHLELKEGRDATCCFWRLCGRGRDRMDEEGGKLAEIGGITYLAI